MEGFDIGDVVTLKSGGPPMTIEVDKEGDEYVCVWFEGSETKRGAFPSSTLMKHDDAAGFDIG